MHAPFRTGLSLAIALWLAMAPAAMADRADALIAAAERGDGPAVERLLRAGADPNVPSAQGVTALIVALRGGHEDAARALVAFGASVTQPDLAGRTPISEARARASRHFAWALERQAGFAYAVSKLDGRSGTHRVAGGHLTITPMPDGRLIYRFRKPGMPFDEALAAARALGGPGLDYGMQLYEPGRVTFPPAQGEMEPFGRVEAAITLAGAGAVAVDVTLR